MTPGVGVRPRARGDGPAAARRAPRRAHRNGRVRGAGGARPERADSGRTGSCRGRSARTARRGDQPYKRGAPVPGARSSALHGKEGARRTARRGPRGRRAVPCPSARTKRLPAAPGGARRPCLRANFPGPRGSMCASAILATAARSFWSTASRRSVSQSLRPPGRVTAHAIPSTGSHAPRAEANAERTPSRRSRRADPSFQARQTADR